MHVEFISPGIENIVIKIKLKGKSIIISGIYKHPHVKSKELEALNSKSRKFPETMDIHQLEILTLTFLKYSDLNSDRLVLFKFSNRFIVLQSAVASVSNAAVC